MKIVNEHAYIVQTPVDYYAEVCTYLPQDELEGVNEDRLPYLYKVTRYLRGDSPELVVEAVEEAREFMGRPAVFVHDTSEVRSVSFDDMLDEVLEAALIIVHSEYELDEDGDFVEKNAKVADKKADARSAQQFTQMAEEFLVEYIHEYGDGAYIEQ